MDKKNRIQLLFNNKKQSNNKNNNNNYLNKNNKSNKIKIKKANMDYNLVNIVIMQNRPMILFFKSVVILVKLKQFGIIFSFKIFILKFFF